MTRKTLGINIARHEQMRGQKGGILPMGTPFPVTSILPMEQPRRSWLARIWGRTA